jgi:uncharacterized cupredoxin-like copper-binding protein
VLVYLAIAPAFVRAAEPGTGETVIEIKASAGVRFDPPRFAVKPGAKVKIVIENVDDMAHNFVLIAPGARLEVVEAAMTIPLTPNENFIPKSDKILQHSPMLMPGKSATIQFTAPAKEEILPFVCTYPGHGYMMYGAMYVTENPLPPIEKDENLPEEVRSLGSAAKLHAFAPQPPYHYRTFMRDSGPASIAVALPAGQNYCWDAGACRLRYAWRGAFVDPMPHWASNGDAFAEVKGRIYYRAPAGFPLRIGSLEKTQTVQFKGYRLVERHLEFRYEVDGVEVRELIKSPHHGSGLEITYSIAKAAGPVFFVAGRDGGASFASSVGTFKDGVLSLTAEQATSFTITLTEIPGREPLRYWSMNDTLSKKAAVVEQGLIGRAASFDGKKQEHDTGIKTTALLANGATIAAWVKLPDPKAKPKPKAAGKPEPEPVPAATLADQVIIGAVTEGGRFELGWNLDRGTGFGMLARSGGVTARIATSKPVDSQWHHLAVTFTPVGGYVMYFDGQKLGESAGPMPVGAPVFFGSVGGTKFAGVTIDEARLDDRVYTAAEISSLFERERPKSAKAGAQ